MRDYIHRFSKQCNSLPDGIDVDVISMFLQLGCVKLYTTHDLLDIAMNHAFDEEAVKAVFNVGRDKGKAKREDQDEGPSTQRGKKNKKDRR